MKKGTRYLLALAACIGIFVLWVVFQMYVAKGTLVGVLFCGAMFGAWKAIVHGGENATDDKTQEGPSEEKEAVLDENGKDEQ